MQIFLPSKYLRKIFFRKIKVISLIIFSTLGFYHSPAQLITIGTGSTSNSNTTYPAPYGNWYWGAKHQMIIRASEITAAGACAGNITSIAFNVAVVQGTALSGFTISIKSTLATEVTTSFDNTGLTTVFGPQAYTETAGWNTHTFITPFNWDGASNILIEVCFNNSSYTYNAQTYYSATTFNSCVYYNSDAAGVCAIASGSTTTSRPNMRFNITPTGAPVPVMNFSKNCIAYDTVVVTGSKMDSLYIKNTGCDTLSITNITKQTSQYSLSTTTFQILPADSAKLVITFSPTSVGNKLDTLTIFSNAGDSLICLSGVGEPPPSISVSPAFFNVNINNCNDSVNQTLTINNSGPGTLNIYSILPQNSDLGPHKYAYICNSGSNNVSVVNINTKEIVKTITVGTYPWRVLISPNGKFAYVSNRNSNNVSVINTSTLTVVATIALGGQPGGMGITPDNMFLYVGNRSANNVQKIDCNTNTIVATITNGNLNDPEEIGITPDGNRAFVCTQNTGITVIDIPTDAVIGNIPGSYGYHSIVITPDGSKAYASRGWYSEVDVINTSTMSVITTITGFNQPQGLDISLNGNFVYVADRWNFRMAVINTSSNTIVNSFTDINFNLEFWDVAVTPDENFAYLSTSFAPDQNNDVIVVNLSTFAPADTLTTAPGTGTLGMAMLKKVYGLIVNASPASGTVAASGSTNITIEFNALGLNSGTYISNLLINSNDPLNPLVVVPCTMNVIGAPEINFVNTITYLGDPYLPVDSILIGVADTDTFYLKNNGCDTLFITDINKTLSAYSINDTDAVILPGDSSMFAVTFTPPSQGDHNDSLVILNNQNADTVIYLFDVGLPPPVISFIPDTFDITLSCGDSLADTLKIYNSGISDLTYSLTSTSIGTNGTITFNEAFVSGQTPTTQVTAWVNFRAQLTPRPYNKLKVSGSNNPTGITLTDAVKVNAIASAMNTLTNYSVADGANTWAVNINSCGTGVLLRVNTPVCSCDGANPNYYTIRPEIGNSNWGGINTTNCTGPSQTMIVEFTYGTPFMQLSQNADTVVSGDSSIVEVTFNSSGMNAGTYTGIININSNDPASPVDSIPVILNVTGTGEITLSKNCMYLDSIMEYTTKKDSLYIKNTGCDTLLVTNITDQTSVFSFTYSGDTLVPLDSFKVVVTFAPITPGTFYDTLKVFSNNGDSLICLSGKAFSRPIESHVPDTLNVTLACADTLIDTLTVYNTGLNNLIFSTGISGKSLALDGSGDYLNRNTTSLPTGSVMTASAWIYPVGYADASYNGIVSWGGRFCTGNAFVLSIQNNGRPSMATWCKDFVPVTGPTATLNQWNHIACVMNGNSVTLYMNGTAISGTLAAGLPNVQNFNLSIGSTDYPGRYFNGKIDEVRIYNTALTQAEIQDLMNKQAAGNEAGLVSYFNFDNGTATDLTANTNDLTFNGNSNTALPNAPVIGPVSSWLDYNFLTDTIPTNDSAQIPVTIISTGLNIGQYSSNVFITSNDPLNSPDTVPVVLNVIGAAQITLSENCIALDSIMEYNTDKDTFYIKNTGCDSLKVSNITTQTANFSVAPVTDTILVLDSAMFVVTFNPTSTGTFNDTIKIFSNAGDSLICLSGKGFARPIISHSPDSINVTLACSDTVTVPLKIYNTGGSDLFFNIDTTDYYANFDGADDYIRVLNTYNGLNTVTLEAWIYPTNTTGLRWIVSNSRDCCTPTGGFGMFLSGTTLNGQIWRSTGSNLISIASTGIITLNTWQHVAMVYDGTKIMLYRNGALVATSSTNALSSVLNGSQNLHIGVLAYSAPSFYDFAGRIDEVRIWETNRSQSQISTDMNKTLLGNEQSLRGYWNFEAQNANDVTAYANNGTLFGNTSIVLDPSNNIFTFTSPLSDTVAVGDSAIVNVVISSTNYIVGTYYDTIFITSNDPLNNPDTVPVIMNVVGTPQMVISDTCLAFDTIMEFTNISDTFYITNTGCDTLFISAITSPDFFIDSLTIDSSGGYILPGDTELISIFFAPDSVGNFTGNLTLNTNDYDTVICLNGVAFPRPIISFAPDTVEVTAICADTIVDTLTIYNNGLSGLIFSTSSTDTGRSALFDGVNDYVNLGTWFNYQTFTIEMWVKPGATQMQYADIIDNNHTGARSWVLQQNNLVTNQYSWGTNDGGVSALFNLTANQWTHIAVTRDGATKTNKVFINGSLFSTWIGTVNVPYDGTQFFRLGRWGGGTRYWNGRMDEVNVWNIERTQAQIISTMNKRLSGNESGLLDYLNYDDGTANDVSSNGNNGTFVNGAIANPPNAPVSEAWLSYSPVVSDTILTNDSSQIGFQFISTGLTVGQYTSNIIFNSNDPLNSSDTVPVILNVIGAPIMVLSDSCISFDTIMEFTNLADTLMITNTGCDTLFISAETSLNFFIDSLTIDSAGGYILPGDTDYVQVIFAPDSAGNFVGTLTLNTNDYDTVICLNGVAFPRPTMSVIPDTITLNYTACCDSTIIPITIYNTGGSALNWTVTTSGGFFDDVESGPGNWAATSLWHRETAQSSSPVTSWTYNTGNPNYNFAVGTSSGSLTSEIIDLTSISPSSTTLLEFNCFYNTEGGTTYDQRWIQVSVNGGAFTNYIQLSGETMSSWHQHSYNFSAYNGNNIQVRYYFNSMDGVSNGGWGWSVDNISVESDAANCNSFLCISPDSGSTAAGDSTVVDIEFNSCGISNGTYTAEVVVLSNDPFNPTDTVQVIFVMDGQPELVLSDSCVLFDTIMEFTTIVDTLMITNTGCDTLFVSAETSLNFFIDSLTIDSAGGYILPGDTDYVQVIFAPDSIGNFIGTFALATNDYDTVICLNGVAFPRPIISVVPDTVIATITFCQDSVNIPLLVSNDGGSNLIYTVDDSPLWLTANPNSGTIVPADSDTTLITVYKSGLSFGVNNFVLPISSNDPLDTLFSVVFTVTVDSVPPMAPVVADTSICFGQPTPALIANGDSIRWYNDAALTNMVANGDTFVTGVSAVGIYTYYVTNTDSASNCQSQSDTVVLSINSPPAEPNALDTVVCSSGTIPNLTSAGTIVKWYADAALTNLLFTGPSFNTGNTASGTYTYYVTDSVGGCASSVADTSVLTINNAATTNAGNDTSICEGSAYTLAGAIGGGAALFGWTTSGTGTFDDDSILNAAYTPSGADIIAGNRTLTITTNDPDAAGPCLSVSDVMVLTINPAAIVNAGVDSAICGDVAYVLQGSMSGSASTTSWTTNGTGTFNNAALLAATYTASGADITAGSVKLTLLSNDPVGPCPAAIDSMTLTLNSPATVNAGVDAIICSSQTYTLNGTRGGSATSSAWTTSGNGTFNDSSLLAPVYTPGATDISTGSVTLTITTNDPAGPCSFVSDIMILTINSTPAVPSSSDTTVCSDTSIPNLTTTGTNIQWYSDAGLTTLAGTGNSFNTAQTLPGSYKYWLTDSLSGCPSSAADSATLTINQAATVSAGVDSVICQGSSYTLGGAMGGSASSINWTTSGDGTFNNATSLTAIYTPGSADISAGTVTITITTNDPDVAGPCTVISDAMILTINPAAAVNAGVDATICQGSAHTLSGTVGGGASTVTWATLGTGTFNNQNLLAATYTPSVADISAGSVSLVITSNDPAGPCPSVTDTMILTINIAATVNAGIDTAICIGNNLTLGGTRGGGATSSAWTTSGDGTFNDSSSLSAIYTPGATDNINGNATLTITSNDPDAGGPCSAVIDSMVLTINSAPSEPVASDTTICSGVSTPNLTASGTILKWYNNGSLTNLVFTGASFASSDTVPGTFNYFVTDSVPGCPPSPADTSTLVINPLPSAPVSADTAICDGSTVPNLIAFGDSIRWYDNAALTNLVANNDTFATPASGVGVYSYYATQTDLATGCQGSSDTVTLTINAIPVSPATNNETICEETPTPVLVAVGSNIQWYSDSSLTIFEFSGDSFASGDTSAGVFTYYVTQTISNCESPSSTAVLTIYGTPAAPTAVDTSVCQGSPNPPLIASGTNIQWFSDSTLVIPIFGGDTFFPSDAAAGSYIYWANQTVNSCPGPGTTATLTIKPIPLAPLSSDTAVCYGSPVPDLIATGANLKWYSDSVLATQVGTGSSFATGDTAIGSYTYFVTDSLNNCGAGPSTAVTLTIDILPVAPGTTDASSCAGDSVPPLIATGTNIQWYSDAGLTSLEFSGDTFATGDIAVGTYTYYATSSSTGCGESSADSAILTINSLPASPSTTDAVNCFGSPTGSLVASGTNIKWYSNATLTTLVFSGDNFAPGDSSSGTYTYYATQEDSATGCVSAADSATLTINALPSAPVSSDTTVIYGNPVPDLTATGSNIQWYSDSALTILEASGNNFSTGDTAIGSSTYYVTQSYSITGCKSVATSATLTILPGAPTAAGNSSCEGDSVPSLSATGTNIQWYSDSVLTILVDSGNTFTPSDSIAGSYSYYATQTINGFEGPGTSAALTINPLPAAPATSGDVSICESGIIPVLIANGTNINWYNDSLLTSFAVNNDTLVTGQTAAGIYTYYATETLLGCEGTASAVTLTIKANPSAPLASDSSSCYGGAIPDLAASGTNVLWYSDSNLTIFEFAGSPFATGDTAAGTYTFYAVDTMNGCTSAYTQVNLLISSPASAPTSATTSVDPTCPGAPTMLNVSGTLSTGTLWRWYSTSCGGTLEGNGDSLVVSPLTTTSYFVRAEGGCDTTSCVNVTVNVTNTLSIAASGSTTDVDSICPGTTATLIVNSGSLGTGANWQWYSANCGGTSIGSGDSVSVTPPTTTTYFVRAEGTCNTTVCDSVTVNIDIPTAPLANNETICEGQTVPDLVAAGANVNWYSDSTLTTNVFTGNSFATGDSAAEVYIYYATETNAGGCEGPATAVVLTINSIPSVPAVSDETGCEGGNVPDLTSSGTFIQWYSDSALTSLVASGDTFSTGQTSVGTYTYFVTDSVIGCEGPASAVILTINVIPFAPVTSSGSGCSGDSIASVFATGTNIQWYADSAQTIFVSSGDTLKPGLLPPGTYTYYATQTVNGCESPVDSSLLTVFASPAAPASSNETICEGTAVPYLVAAGTNINWYDDSLLTNNVSTNDSFATGQSTTGVFVYYATETQNGCAGTATAVTLTINAIPAAPSTGDETACASGIIPDLSATGTNINWYDDSLLTNNVGSGNNFTTGETAIGSYTYYATETVNSCVSSANSSTLTIIGTPATPVANDVSICVGTAVPDLNSSSGNNIQWYDDATLTNVVNTGSNFNTGQTAVGVYTYYVTDSLPGCVSQPDTVTLAINAIPSAPVGSNVSTCYGSPVPDLTVTGSNINWYSEPMLILWLDSGNSLATGKTQVGTYVYYATQTVNGCTSAASAIKLGIFTNPDVTLNSYFANINSGQSVSLIAYNATSYTWSPSTWLNTTSNDTVISTPDSTITYTVIGTNDMGCSDTESVTVNVKPVDVEELENRSWGFEVYPNPNKGKFEVRITNKNEFTNHKLKIYNMLGEIVFTSSEISNPIFEIDLHKSGSGVYYVQMISEKGLMTKRVIVE